MQTGRIELVFGHKSLQALRVDHKGIDEMLKAIEQNGPMAAMEFQQRDDIKKVMITVMPGILDEVLSLPE